MLLYFGHANRRIYRHSYLHQSKDTEKALHWAKESAIAAKTSADAGLLNAKAIINAERAWITASLNWQSTAGRIIQGEDESALNVRFVFENQGRTPAWITSRVYGCIIRDKVPEEPDFDSLDSTIFPRLGDTIEPFLDFPKYNYND